MTRTIATSDAVVAASRAKSTKLDNRSQLLLLTQSKRKP